MLLKRLFLVVGLLTTAVAISGDSFAQDVEYELRFEGQWTANLPRPGNAHFTTIIGATHNSSGSIFEVGQMASAGVESVAELGTTGTLVNEITQGINAGTLDQQVFGTNSFIGPEQVNTFNFFANDSHSRVSFLTMIAPSPDWFVGVSDLNLQNASGAWRQEIVLPLNSYDAGTENGIGLSLNNPATNPQQPIDLLDSAEPNGALVGAGSIAQVTLTLVSVPEPGSFAFLLAAGLMAAGRRRRIFAV